MYQEKCRSFSKFELSAILCFFCLSGFVSAQNVFVPNETLVSSQRDMRDPEINQEIAQFVWADAKGQIWIGHVSRVTGDFDPKNGKAILVDTKAQRTDDLQVLFNGPEWIATAAGFEITYTKFLAGTAHIAKNARLARARKVDNAWIAEVLSPDDARNAPYGSNDKDDPNPRITYVDQDFIHYWREVNEPATEEVIPFKTGKRSVRWVDGKRWLIYAATMDQYDQIVLYDVDTKAFDQLTFDAGNKDITTVPWMWPAPEYGGEYIFCTVVEDTELRIYRNIDVDNQGKQWSPIVSMQAPSGGKIVSPEPFVHNGKSYLIMAMITPPNRQPTAIWLADLDPTNPSFRKVSDDSLFRLRIDPEIFVLESGPHVYYNRFDPSVKPGSPYAPGNHEGVFRADLGLGPVLEN